MNQHPMWRRVALWAAALGVAMTALVLSATPANAAPGLVWRWVAVSNTYIGTAQGSWHQCGIAVPSPEPASLSCAKSTGGTVTFSASVTGTVWLLAATQTQFLGRSGRWPDWLDVQRAGLAAAVRLGDPVVEARCHHTLGQALTRWGDLDAAILHTRPTPFTGVRATRSARLAPA